MLENERTRIRNVVARVINRTGGRSSHERADAVMDAIWPVPTPRQLDEDSPRPETQPRVVVKVGGHPRLPGEPVGEVTVRGADSFFVTQSGCLVVRETLRAVRTFATGEWREAEVRR